MTSLRERLDAKWRRTAVLPVQVGDTAAAAQEAATLRAALDVHLAAARGEDPVGDVETDTVVRLREQLSAAMSRLAETVVNIELQSLEPDVWDQVLEDLQPDEAGELDLGDVRAALLAASCVDESLRDEAAWAQRLASPAWSKGDTLACNRVLLSLNLDVASGAAGKG